MWWIFSWITTFNNFHRWEFRIINSIFFISLARFEWKGYVLHTQRCGPLRHFRLYRLMIHFWYEMIKVIWIVDFFVTSGRISIFNWLCSLSDISITSHIIINVKTNESISISRFSIRLLLNSLWNQSKLILLKQIVFDPLLTLYLISLLQHCDPIFSGLFF